MHPSSTDFRPVPTNRLLPVGTPLFLRIFVWLCLVLASLTAPALVQAQTVQSFTYTGAPESYTVPAGVTSLNVVAKGAAGGTIPVGDFDQNGQPAPGGGYNSSGNRQPGGNGGNGGLVTVTLSVMPGQILSIYVGGSNGYNGGGAGGSSGSGGKTGGGATDIRTGGITLDDRVLVAGGGGGAGDGTNGGSGGNLYGEDAPDGSGKGGSPTAGGAGNSNTGVLDGEKGIGSNSTSGGGGGGGYYGGSGGEGGGGGSSYPDPNNPPVGIANVDLLRGTNSGDGSLTISYTTPAAAPARLYVNVAQTTNPGNGLTWATAFPTIEQATTYANNTALTEIFVAKGLYTPAATLSMLNNVGIYGGFDGTEMALSGRTLTYPLGTTISGGGTIQVFNNSGLNNTAVLDGFVITGGNINGDPSTDTGKGGGILNTNSSPKFVNLLITNNYALKGGGMYNKGEYGTIASPVLINVRFVSNSSTEGGGLQNNGAFGGNSSPTLVNVSFTGNTSSGNTSSGNGGAIFNQAYSGTAGVTLTNVSFSANTASGTGGAIYNFFAGATASLTNGVVFGSGSGALTSGSGGANPVVTYSLLETKINGGSYTDGGNNLTTKFSPFVSASNLSLNNCSPAINVGDNNAYTTANGPSTDLAGQPRLFNNTIDMGAYEFQSIPVPGPSRVYVNASAMGANTGLSWTDAFTDLQSALNYFCPNNLTEIWVAGGTYKPTPTTDLSISFTMLPGVAIYGGFAGGETLLSQRPATNPVTGQPSSTTLSGDIDNDGTLSGNSDRIIFNENLTSSAVLDGFVITGGNPDKSGGGMYNGNSNPTLNNCLFIGNAGGAMTNNTNSNPTLTNCSFANNPNGAMSNSGSSPVLTNCSFLSNTANAGGAIANSFSNPTLINCAFQGNLGDRGGAISNDGGCLPTLTNCSFQGNVANNGSVMISNTGDRATLTNCVLFNNGSNTFSQDYPTVSNSLLDVSVNNYTDGGNNKTTAVSPFVSATDLRLSGCNPALNAGDNTAYSAAGGPATDLAGATRIFSTTIDMGAYEYQAAPTVGPSRLYVNAGASATGQTGLDWNHAFTELQSALNYFCPNNLTEIWVANGMYKPTLTTDRSISFAMLPGVAIYGSFAGGETSLASRALSRPSSTTLSGDIGTPGDNTDNSYHVVTSSGLSADAILDGFLITVGNATGTNGYDGTGGGMFNLSSNPTIRNCTFQGNSAVYSGGGMFNVSSNPALTNCAFQGNSGDRGGAIANNSSSPTLTNCSFQGNSSTSDGGAIYIEFGSLTLTNCSFQGNSSTNDGGAIYSFISPGASPPTLTNCVLFDNGGSKALSVREVMSPNTPLINATYSLFDATVTGYTADATNKTTTVSPFVSATDLRPSSCSPAINAGDNTAYSAAGGPATDLAGATRIFSTTIDMGAYEYQGTGNLPTTITAQPVASSVVCAGVNVAASISVTGATTSTTYQWYNGTTPVTSQTTATLSLPSAQTANAGSYSVVVTSACNSVTSTVFSLTVNALPMVNVSPTGTTICTGTSTTLTANGGTSYTWTGGQSTSAISVSLAGTYSVTATVSGCSGVASATVTARSSVSVTAITPASLTICEEQPLSLTATVTGGASYSLTVSLFNGPTRVVSQTVVVAANQSTASISIPQTGTLTSATIVAVATSAGGCSTTFVGPVITIRLITFAGPPTLNSTVYSPGQTAVVRYSAAQCAFKPGAPYTVELLSAATNYTIAQVLTPVSASATSLSVVIPASIAPGTYKLQVVYGDPVYSPVSVTFVVNSLTLTITASSTVICVGQPVSLTASGCGTGSTYRWSTGQMGPVITYTPMSTSLVSVTCITGGPRIGAPDAFDEPTIDGADASPGNASPGAGGAAEADKPSAILFRPARDPRGSWRE